MTSNEIINNFFSEAKVWGAEKKPRSSLVSPYFKDDFNLSAGHQYVIPILKSNNPKNKIKISINEPCFRRVDLKTVGYSISHLLLFEMGVFGVFGAIKHSDEILFEIFEFAINWLNNLGIKKSELIFTISSGANVLDLFFEKDTKSQKLLRKVGIENSQILLTKGRRNFIFSQGENRPAGYSIEIFYKCNESFVEIASINIYSHIFKDGTLIKCENLAYGCGFGFDRINFIINNLSNVFETDNFQPFNNFMKSLVDKKATYNIFKNRFNLIGELIKSLMFTISDGQIPEKSPRGKIQRKLLKSVLSEFDYLDLKKDVVLTKIVNTFVESFSTRYPELKEKETFILEVLSSNLL